MKVDVVLGLQWGDEGKGKVVDVLTPSYGVIARFQGGPNAGHSLKFNDRKYVLHTIPSGIFRAGAVNVIGNGVVMDPVIFAEEVRELEKEGEDINGRIRISKRAHLIIPTHRMLDAASEQAKGKTKIGSTLKGIGPTYMDKTGRNGLRVGDILLPDFKERYDALKAKHEQILGSYGFKYDVTEYEKQWFEALDAVKRFDIIDSEYEMDAYLRRGKGILAEGAQGTMLDIDFGTYPFVTSSNTTTAGVCTGLGIAPNRIGRIYGIFKAYCTRVGSGPFPTELFDKDGDTLCEVGCEVGATTGRRRRCGWLDLVALKYAVMINGVNSLIMMKSDVLNGFDTIKVATSYIVDGKKTDRYPFDPMAKVEPVYTEFKGWKCDISKARSYDELPEELKKYISFIETELQVPIKIVSVGADRAETILR